MFSHSSTLLKNVNLKQLNLIKNNNLYNKLILKSSFGTSSEKLPYSERQSKLGRPISPHVTIYKFPITALTSIANRGTGIMLTVGIEILYIYDIYRRSYAYFSQHLIYINIKVGSIFKIYY